MKKSNWFLLVLAFLGGVAFVKLGDFQKESKVLSATDSMSTEERLTSLENRVWTLEKNAGLIKSKSTKTTEKFVNLVGGSTGASSWEKINGTEFYFDASLYGNSVEVTWQGWLEGGSGGVRIYDATNHRAVDYSEATTNTDSKVSFYSKPMSIWRGQNLYYLEGKSSNGRLEVSSPRLRVVSK